MKLKELFGFTGEGQVIRLQIERWCITAEADALECCLNDEVLNGTITSINAEGSDLVVGVDCEDDD